jgi:hypothetical protein
MSRKTLGLALLALSLTVVVAAPARATVAGIPSTYPGANLAPIQGMAYQPAPSDYAPCSSCPYYDTDFFNSDFPGLWDDSQTGYRGDLANFKSLGVNLLHLYDWNPARNHASFLAEAAADGIAVAVPISNYFVDGSDPNAAADIATIVSQAYTNGVPTPGVGMLTIANEYDISGISAAQVAQAAASIVAAETAQNVTQPLPIAVPVSFGLQGGTVPGVVATQNVMAAFTAQAGLPASFVSSRFIAATNPQNDGDYLSGGLPGGQSYYQAFAAAIPNTPLWFSELGTGVLDSCSGYPAPCTPSQDQQETFNAGQWAAAVPGAGSVLLGSAQFEFEDELWKGSPTTTNDATFGVYEYATPASYTTLPTTNGTYRVDAMTANPSLTALTDAFSPSMFVSGTSAAVARAAAVTPTHRIPDNDIAVLDRATGTWTTLLDGSRVGLRGNAIDSFTVAPRGDVLLTLRKRQRLRGAGRVSAHDVVRYDPKRHTFARVMRLRRDPSAIAVTPKGRLVVAFRGSHDLVVRSGKGWRTYLPGSAIGLTGPGEQIDSAWIDPRSGDVYLSTNGPFTANGVTGDRTDVLAASHKATGWKTRIVWRGHANGLGNANVTGFAFGRR